MLNPTKSPATFRFIDLFAGLGGFHVALSSLGGECVFASEIDATLKAVYKKNFGLAPKGDIRDERVQKYRAIPDHDVLCAGFPCQPFSKAGEQLGLACPDQGDLFHVVRDILKAKRPRYFVLENVPNLLKHEGGDTYSLMKRELTRLGYSVAENLFSPHQFGVPQIRERAYIVGSLDGLDEFAWPDVGGFGPTDIRSVLESAPDDARPISAQLTRCLDAWQRFLDRYPHDEELPSFPIWSMEFGADYPFDDFAPATLKASQLGEYRGAHGFALAGLPPGKRLESLPSYARLDVTNFPTWKRTFIRQNRDLYARHKSWLRSWIPHILEFPPSLQKFEWNCKGEVRSVWDHVLQIRASGVRTKRPSSAPSLVAMTTTQVPIIGWERRYMTPRECANLQSLGSLAHLPATPTRAFKALGNAVNASVVQAVAAGLLGVELASPRGNKLQRAA